MSYLSTTSTCHKRSVLPLVHQLDLFLSEDGLVCTKGCFTLNSSFFLLPRHSHFTDLLVLDCNLHTHHIGVGGTIIALCLHFSAPTAPATTRHILHCVTSHKVTGRHYPLSSSPDSLGSSGHLCASTF